MNHESVAVKSNHYLLFLNTLLIAVSIGYQALQSMELDVLVGDAAPVG